MKIRQKRPPLIISIEDPKPINQQLKQIKIEGNKKTKEILVRQKNRIEQMENEIRKLTNKIDSERHLLRNKIMAQELEYELKKNEIAARMSKRQIILKRLQIIRGTNHKQEQGDKIYKKYQHHDKNASNHFSAQKSLQKIAKQQMDKKSTQKPKTNIVSIYKNNDEQLNKLEKLKQIMNKQKQYGNRVQRQFLHNRSKSALSYLQIKRMEEFRRLKQQERQRILQQMKKPNIPIRINAKVDKRKQIDRIRSSSQPIQQKLILLNYMSQVQLNRVKLKQIRGEQEDLDTLTHLNRARTSIILGRQ